jgi:lipopolysaccharide/colanic/teichoic acid biosynthesis glycosyltransferase
LNKLATVLSQRVSGATRGSARRRADWRRIRLTLYTLLLAADSAMLAAAFLLADMVRFGALVGYGITTFTVILPIYVAVGISGNAWSLEALSSVRSSVLASTRALFFAIGVAAVLFFSLKIGEAFSRLVFGLGCCFALPMLAVSRVQIGRWIGARYEWNFRKEILLLDGLPATPIGKEIVIDGPVHGLAPDTADPSMLNRLAEVLEGSERVTIACPPERRQAWARTLAGANVEAEILSPELDTIGALGLRRRGSMPALLVASGPLRLRDRAVKRMFDLGLSVATLPVLAPLMLVAAVAIRLESPGPILFSQMRMGRGNRLFRVLKFRTMLVNAEDELGARSVGRGDERVTRVGRLLRRTSFDELPQLWNVLNGEMSIVGPRPHALGTRAEDQLLWAVDDRYWDRHAIKPGLTGLAQVRGQRGATETRGDLTARLRSDLEYVEGWHLGRDIAIVLRTATVLVHRNAF